ncbi:gamma-glutamyl-gamma-aminobutyraldehyde dehydrogenase/4-guanidinobutyraldehyde dehydrogenase/NAD-dependent aldehyde dehydrogenase [Nonomuraea thailandensis]|uniref:Gamma-glutamyl-gamma-aminobutyraldehyde dehydrogenase/4-guanidinobutyraldehyde dehydrogenase/NAD-dependent aldehyde dehydrogenase n=1 Tax=Nonomuraea thailandensis TaxID=1188745 RepID=A0A9X2K1D7_9ACTN|nr:aldehyde dehydrogenase [Nonomuraea thailandensis]MCP2356873.1 gamma-glutamyl-gamma-aminobutyraldehyde dehydrogenase/4-guanidinobutyraldehyde dehydrogenase/NAD-dependent aldehyde dehydrogenase [Nonomuraea thailandensis]
MTGPMHTKPTDTMQAALASLRLHGTPFIDGVRTSSQEGATFADHSPIDGRLLLEVSACDAADVDVAVRAARRAFDDGRWRDQPPRARKRVLLAWADLLEAHAEELALTESLDVGKPITDARTIDVPAAVRTVRWYAEAIDKVYGETAPTGSDVLATVTREPIGVVGCVTPWNFPLYMACLKLAPALAAGCSVVLKPAEQSPLTALRAAELAVEAGLPSGVLNVVPGFGETAGQALGRHPDVDALAFTGSTEVGKLFLRYSGESNMKRVSLECGGKTPHIVMADAQDLQAIARAVTWGIFLNAGQVCNAGSRLLVDRRVKHELLEHITAQAGAIRLGDPLDPATELGAVIDHDSRDRILARVREAQNAGGRLVLGGAAARVETGGAYVEPTIVDHVGNDTRLAQEEVFGPVLAVIDFDGPEQAVELANASAYGLAAALWTQDVDVALNAARRLRSGTVWINNFDDSDITTPWGGFRQSGIGRDKSLHALDKYMELKTTWISIRHQ